MGDEEANADFPDNEQRFAVCSSIWRDKDKAMSDEVQFKSVSLSLKKEPDEDGTFEGYASVFGIIDQGMDVVERGAFRKSLGGGRKVKMLWQHDMAQPIGVWDEIQEDERGLFVRGRLLKDVQKGREAMALMRAGALDSMSIGYRTVEAVAEGDGRVRKLMEIILYPVMVYAIPLLTEIVHLVWESRYCPGIHRIRKYLY